MNFVKVFINDLKAMTKSKLFLISVIAIIIVPVLYSLLYLKAFWDPYGSLDNLPVAVVNLDEGAYIDGEKVNYGDDVVEKLKSNTNVKWKFVSSSEEADKGLEGNDYYAKFQIDSDFSEKVISAKKGNIEKAGMEFVCNQKKNYLASQVTSKVQSVLKEEIVSTITDNYVTATFDNLYEVKDGMQSAADGSKKIDDGVNELNNKLPKLQSGADKIQAGTNELYTGEVSLNNGISELNGGLEALNNGTQSLLSGSSSLYTGAKSLKDGVNSINGGLGQLNEKSMELSSGISKLTDGSNNLYDGIGEVKGGTNKLSLGSKSLYNSYTSTVAPSIKSLNEGAKTLNSSIESGNDNLVTLKNASYTLNSSSDDIKKASDNLENGYSDIKAGIDMTVSASDNTENVMNEISKDLQNAMMISDESAKNQKIMEALNKMQEYQKENEGTKEKLNALKTGAATYETNYKIYNSKVNDYTNGVKSFSSGTNQLIGNVTNIGSGVNQISNGIDNLYKGLNTSFEPGLKQISESTLELDNGMTKIQAGGSNLASNLNIVNQSMPSLKSGVNSLYEGSTEALRGADKLYDGGYKLYQGVSDVNIGASKLYAGSNEALQGSNKLTAGSLQLKDGVDSMKNAMPNLISGVDQLKDGTGKLSQSINDGATSLNDGLVNSSEDMGEFVSNPVELKIDPVNKVDNYGSGFAPYFMNLSLWVGAIMMFFVIDTEIKDRENTSRFNKVFGKFLTCSFVGILQAILVGISIYSLGLRPQNIVLYFAELIFFSLVYISIVQCLVTLFGDPGRLLSIVFLILQLTGCAGTFPLEMIPSFFNKINPYMPFTYAVEILREVNAAETINYSMIGKDMIVLLVFFVLFLGANILLKNVGEKILEIYENKREGYRRLCNEE